MYHLYNTRLKPYIYKYLNTKLFIDQKQLHRNTNSSKLLETP